MGSEIPTRSRVLVRARDQSRCARCRVLNGGLHWHHRRTRSVHDDHQHCPCVGIMLCSTCHKWVHEHPMQARAQGWIVSRHEAEPFRVPFACPPRSWVLPDCDGEAKRVWATSLDDALERFGIEGDHAQIVEMRDR